MGYTRSKPPETFEYDGALFFHNEDLEIKTKSAPNHIYTKTYSNGRITALLVIVRTNRDYSLSRDGVEGLAELEKAHRAGKGGRWPVCQSKITLVDRYSFGLEVVGVMPCESFLKNRTVDWRPPMKERYGEWCWIDGNFEVVGSFQQGAS